LPTWLDRIMAVTPIGEPGAKLRKCIAAHREHLFVFMTHRPANGISVLQAIRAALAGAPVIPELAVPR
jgi:hypothetical protein